MADSPDNAVKAGSTEWTGKFGDGTMSIGWDWFQDVAGRLYLNEKVPPRSNIKLLDDGGYDTSSVETDLGIVNWLKGMPFWHATVLEMIAGGLEENSSPTVNLMVPWGSRTLPN
jgi:hypothetical protein